VATPGALTDEYLLERAILSAHNDDVDDLNSTLLDRMPGEKLVFRNSDSVEQKAGEDEVDETAYAVETLNALNLAGLPLSKLELKVGCPLMILRNLDAPNGVCNGTRGVLTRAGNRVLEVRILGGEFAGQTTFVPA
jgi:ATP-dependent DNA helicase PIF1